MSDKTKYKNWIDGDIFAIKIENINPEYDGQYIILIKCDKLEIKEWKQSRKLNTPFFYAKITTNYTIPKTKEEIDGLEFIKLVRYNWESRYLPFDGMETYEELKERKKHIKFYPDEFMYLYCYIIELYIGKKHSKILNKMNFIGNFKIEPPFDEYIPGNLQLLLLKDNFLSYFIDCYENYNKRKNNCYSEEGIQANKNENIKKLKVYKHMDEAKIYYRKNGKFPKWKQE